MIKYWESTSRAATLAILQLCPVANRECNSLFSKAGNTFEAEASRGVARHPRHTASQTEEFFQFLRGMARSVHTAHKEGNSSGLPHFDLPTRNGSDHGSL